MCFSKNEKLNMHEKILGVPLSSISNYTLKFKLKAVYRSYTHHKISWEICRILTTNQEIAREQQVVNDDNYLRVTQRLDKTSFT